MQQWPIQSKHSQENEKHTEQDATNIENEMFCKFYLQNRLFTTNFDHGTVQCFSLEDKAI